MKKSGGVDYTTVEVNARSGLNSANARHRNAEIPRSGGTGKTQLVVIATGERLIQRSTNRQRNLLATYVRRYAAFAADVLQIL
jgi:hypothetical protein